MQFGDILAELRKDKGMLQKELAEILHVSVSTISNYETNAHFPDIHTLITLSDYFQVSIDYLLGRSRENAFQSQTEDEVKLYHYIRKYFAKDERSQKALVTYLEMLADSFQS